MSKRMKNGRNSGEGRFVRLFHWMLQTPAWRSLGSVERALYVEILGRYGGPSTNNGSIGYSIREAATALRIGKTRAAEAFSTLEERGFIGTSKKGHFDRKVRHSTEWRLTEYGCDMTGALATKDFARWSPDAKSRYPRADRTVPDGGPIGTRERTGNSENRLHGT